MTGKERKDEGVRCSTKKGRSERKRKRKKNKREAAGMIARRRKGEERHGWLGTELWFVTWADPSPGFD